MTTTERKRIARELAADLKKTLLENVGKFNNDWDGRHVRAFALMVMERDGNHPSVKAAGREIRKSMTQYALSY